MLRSNQELRIVGALVEIRSTPVVFLQLRRIIQTHAVVHSTTTTHGICLQLPKPSLDGRAVMHEQTRFDPPLLKASAIPGVRAPATTPPTAGEALV